MSEGSNRSGTDKKSAISCDYSKNGVKKFMAGWTKYNRKQYLKKGKDFSPYKKVQPWGCTSYYEHHLSIVVLLYLEICLWV